jgi:hypothetical protein
MSTSGFEALAVSTSRSTSPSIVASLGTSGAPINSPKHPANQLACYVDLQYNPFTRAAKGANPLQEFLSDDLYQLLRANDIINEKGLRDFIIRRVFRKMKEQQELRTADAINKIQELYPYLQIDTIRKIVYRVYPTSQRKMMI